MNNYKEQLLLVEQRIDELIKDIINNEPYKSTKADERLTAMCLSREYLLSKIENNKQQEGNK